MCAETLKHEVYFFVSLYVEKTWYVSTSWGPHSAAETWDLLETNWMGARKKAVSHATPGSSEMSTASDGSLAYSHKGVKVMLCCGKKINKDRWIYAPVWKRASLSPSSPRQHRNLWGGGVRNQVPWKMVGCNACVSKEYAAVFSGGSPPGKSHPRQKPEFLGEKWRQESWGRWFRTAAHQVCACTWGRPNLRNVGIFVLSERTIPKATAKLQSKMHKFCGLFFFLRNRCEVS